MKDFFLWGIILIINVIAFILIFSLTIPMYARAAYPKTEVKAYFYNEEQSGTFDCIFSKHDR